MDNNHKKENIILKRPALPGVDMSVVDLELVSTVKVRVTIVKKPIYKIKGQTFIGTRDQLDKMDVIQVGSLRLKYRVMKLAKMTDYDGYIYRIKRIDGASTTGLDIDATALGQKVSIVNRPTFDDLFNYACSLKEGIPKEEVCYPTCEPCDKKSPITQSIVSSAPIINAYQFTWPVQSNGDPGVTIYFINEFGQPDSIVIPGCGSKICTSVTVPFCAEYGSIQVSNSVSPIVYAINESCPNNGACTQDPNLVFGGGCS